MMMPAEPVSLAMSQLGEDPTVSAPWESGPSAPASPSFGKMLTEMVRGADDLQKAADETIKDFAAGEVEDVHQVMVALNKADLSFRMILEVRNKLVEAYQEVMRLSV